MTSTIYVYEEGVSKKLREYSKNDEHYCINQYLKEIGKKPDYIRVLGELSRMVYRMNFKMSIDNVEKEYVVTVNTMRDIEET